MVMSFLILSKQIWKRDQNLDSLTVSVIILDVLCYAECTNVLRWYGVCRNDTCHYDERHIAKCHLLSFIMSSVIILCVVMLGAIKLTVMAPPNLLYPGTITQPHLRLQSPHLGQMF